MQDLGRNFLDYAVNRLRGAQQTIVRCTEQLTDAQMQHRGGDYENSIVNLLLHLEGNIRQWILHGVAAQPDVRERDAEFALDPGISAAEALARFNAALDGAVEVVAALPVDRLLERTDPQPDGSGFTHSILEVVFRITTHLHLHTGQIVVLTKQALARDLDLTMPRKR